MDPFVCSVSQREDYVANAMNLYRNIDDDSRQIIYQHVKALVLKMPSIYTFPNRHNRNEVIRDNSIFLTDRELISLSPTIFLWESREDLINRYAHTNIRGNYQYLSSTIDWS